MDAPQQRETIAGYKFIQPSRGPHCARGLRLPYRPEYTAHVSTRIDQCRIDRVHMEDTVGDSTRIEWKTQSATRRQPRPRPSGLQLQELQLLAVHAGVNYAAPLIRGASGGLRRSRGPQTQRCSSSGPKLRRHACQSRMSLAYGQEFVSAQTCVTPGTGTGMSCACICMRDTGTTVPYKITSRLHVPGRPAGRAGPGRRPHRYFSHAHLNSNGIAMRRPAALDALLY